MRTKRWLPILVFSGLIWGNAHAFNGGEESPGDTTIRGGTAQLRIETDTDSAIVYLRGQVVGRTPFTADSLAAGTYDVRILHQDDANWLTPAITDTILLLPGQNRLFRYSLAGGLVVRSQPDGASVMVHDSLLGVTPLVLLHGRWSPGMLLQVQKAGYAAVLVDPTLASRGVLTVPLQRQPGIPEGRDEAMLVDMGSGSNRALGLYISGGVALVAGVASAYLKISADQRQEAYSTSGDPTILSERNSLDTAAGITFVAMQLSLALFSYFLLTE